MSYIVDRSDASLIYRASSGLDIASLDSTAAWGNLADAMKNATVVIPNTVLLEPPAVLPGPVNDAEIVPITNACNEASEDGKEVAGVEPATATEELPDELAREYPAGSLGRFAQLALKSGMASKESVDTSALSREILTSEFANHIDRRIRR